MKLSEMSAEATLALGNRIASVLANGGAASYGISPATLTSLNEGDSALGGVILKSDLLRDESKATTTAKTLQRRTMAAQIASIHASVLNNPNVNDEMLQALGFAPRRGGAKPAGLAIAQVTGVEATPTVDGTVELSWSRGANAQGTMFVIEASLDGLEWTPIKTTTRVKYVAPGFAPGAVAYFRVTATTSTNAALPSRTVGIYLPASTAPALRLAA